MHMKQQMICDVAPSADFLEPGLIIHAMSVRRHVGIQSDALQSNVHFPANRETGLEGSADRKAPWLEIQHDAQLAVGAHRTANRAYGPRPAGHRLERLGEAAGFQVHDESIGTTQSENVVRRRVAEVQHDPGLAVFGPDPDIFHGGCRLRCSAEQDQNAADEKTRKSQRVATTLALICIASVYEIRSEFQEYSFQN